MDTLDLRLEETKDLEGDSEETKESKQKDTKDGTYPSPIAVNA